MHVSRRNDQRRSKSDAGNADRQQYWTILRRCDNSTVDANRCGRNVFLDWAEWLYFFAAKSDASERDHR
jgi:hypothetical protein